MTFALSMRRWKTSEIFLCIGVILGLSAVLSVCFYFISQMPESFWGGAGYLGIFVLSFAGASSVVIPIPYTLVLLGIAGSFDPLLLAVAVALGSAAGELIGYGVGYVGGWVMGKERRRQSEAMLRVFNRYGTLVIFIFALTPLPDDLLFIPLGLMHYSLWKAFAVCATGKFFMALIIAHFGRAVGGLFISSWLLGIITTVLLALVVVAMFRIDWVRFAEKYAPMRARIYS
jgi:membrane protein YqaA with SNARE-associated domain